MASPPGFPIMRNKLFAFGSADYAKRDGEGGYTRDFLLPAEINGPWLTRGNDTPAEPRLHPVDPGEIPSR